MKKLTNEIIDQRLQNRNIKRIGNYIDANTGIDFQCLICNHQWITAPNRACGKRKTGCPKCSGGILLSNKEIDDKLINLDIIRIGDYINNYTKTKFRCLIDHFIWFATPYKITSKQQKCPQCFNLEKLTNKMSGKEILFKNIIIVGSDIEDKNKIELKCQICKYYWKARPSKLTDKSGCPKCTNHMQLTNEIIDLRLINKNIIRIDDYPGNITKKINFQCEKCNNIWLTRTSSILINDTGCPYCKTPNKNENNVSDQLKYNNIQFERNYLISNINSTENNKLRIDFFIKDFNTIIEYNGEQHYKPVIFKGMTKENAENNFPKQIERDKYIENFCKINNIKLIIIDGRKYKNNKLKKYVDEIIMSNF